MDLRIDLKSSGGANKLNPSMNNQKDAISQKIFDRGSEIFSLMEADTTSVFNKDWWYGRIMDWSMKNEAFKIQMFRFVDVLPYLNSSDEVARHLKEYFSSQGQEIPSVLGWGLGLGSLAPGLMAAAIRKNVTQMARMFITGETPDEAFKNLEKMRKEKLCFTVDILGEAAVSETEAETYQRRYLELIETLAAKSAKWPEIELIDRDHLGAISKVNVSVKVSSLYSQLDPIDPENSIKVALERLRPIFRRARELNVFINLDMEAFVYKDLTLKLFKALMSEKEFSDYNNVGVVIQAYLRESEQDLKDLIDWAKKRSGRITVRLVKGAYWDYETVLAQQKGWPIPVFTNKKETDANYEKLSLIMLENDRYIKSAFGSHNIRSLAFALAHAERLGIDKRSFEIQMLYGMADPIKKALIKMGLRVREYAPVGELIPGMAYLVRRLLENTSNESFLRAKFSTNLSTEELLRDPREGIPTTPEQTVITGHFENEPPVDFNKNENRKAMLDAIDSVKKKLGKSYPIIIGKKEIKTSRELKSINPANPDVIVGKTYLASTQEAELAVETAKATQSSWAKVPPNERAVIFEKVAEILKARKFELAALEVFEVGKTWREADGDVAEAIDFCRYYSKHLRAISKGQRTSFVPGEESIYNYQPRGVGVVIAPWNFPLAILCGMVAGSAVCGNTVIMKPAEQSSIIAAAFMEVLKEAGLPTGVVSFLPGLGEEVGEHLVKHPDVDFIVFTGSKDVGLHIISTASKTARTQRSVKKVVAEMGGKNAIIIDNDADLDEAVLGTLYSAFGFQGQKCSACSRVIVLEENYDKFLTRLLEGAASLKLGNPELPGTAVGPVVDKDAYDKIMSMIEVGKRESKLAYQATAPANGYFVPPTIFIDVPPTSRLAQEEIFGPVLAVIKAKDFDQALEIANGTPFALTGGIFSRSPAHLEQAKKEFDVGNLYINRGITGALVGRHPFGGFKMSGVGSKAGGPDYLLQFVEPRTVTENTMRRGFAPSSEE
jgi:RHH-type transcriptional regulator, proline utilization regulon repressor / proline dehydrogenase / delta 1-pyrroline-5-carboxylate dehydrogenase